MNATIRSAAMAELAERKEAASLSAETSRAHRWLRFIGERDDMTSYWIDRYEQIRKQIAAGELVAADEPRCPYCGGTLYTDAYPVYIGGHGYCRRVTCYCGWFGIPGWVKPHIAAPEAEF